MRRRVPPLSPLPATPAGSGDRALATTAPAALPVEVAWLPSLVFLLAALPFLAQALGADKLAVAALRPLFPMGVLAPDRVLALLSGTGLAGLTVGLHRRKRLALGLALGVLVAGVASQLMTAAHPIAIGIGVGTAVALLYDRGRYTVRSADGWGRTVAWTLVIAAAGVAFEAIVSLRHPAASLQFDARAAVGSVLSWASFGDRWFPWRHGGGPLALMPSITARFIAAIAILGSLRHAPAPAVGPETDTDARSLLARLGGGALLPFQVAPRMRLFAVPGRRAVVSYATSGRSAIVLGDPVGAPADAWPVFDAFVAECRERDLVPMLYQASGENRHRLLAEGFTCFRVGQEAIVPLEGFSMAGSRRANLRHTVTRARRGGVTVRWFGDGVHDPDLEPQLRAVDAVWRREHPGDMGFTIGEFDAGRLPETVMAVAFEDDGRVAAFTTFLPAGGDGAWVLDLIRRRDGATPGAVECCLVEGAERLAAAGASSLSLGLAPLHGLVPDGGPAEERLLARAAALAKPAYDVQGLAFFKGKFDPVWVPRYGAVPSRPDLPRFATALLSLHLGRSLVAVGCSMILSRAPGRSRLGPALRGLTARLR